VGSPLGSFLCPPGYAGPKGLRAIAREGSAVAEAARFARHQAAARRTRKSTPYALRTPEPGLEPVVLVPGFMAGDGSLSLMARAPGTIPSHVNPPKAPAEGRTPSENLLAGTPEQPKLAAAPAPAPAQAPTRVANAAAAEQNDGWFSSLARKVGLGSAADATASTPPSKPRAAEAKRSEPPRAEAPKHVEAKHVDTKHIEARHADTRQAAASRPPLKPSVSEAPAPAAKENLVSGSAPIVSSNSFDSRFGATR
jgi:hypothetical protein